MTREAGKFGPPDMDPAREAASASTAPDVDDISSALAAREESIAAARKVLLREVCRGSSPVGRRSRQKRFDQPVGDAQAESG